MEWLLLIAVSAAALGIGGWYHRRAGSPGLGGAGEARRAGDATAALASARLQAAETIQRARAEALQQRQETEEELNARRAALDETTRVLAEYDDEVHQQRTLLDEKREAQRERRAALEEEQAALAAGRDQARGAVARIADLEREEAERQVLERIDAELLSEHSDRVARLGVGLVDEAPARAQWLLVDAMQRQDGSHADTAPRGGAIPLEGLDEDTRVQLIDKLQEVAAQTNTEVSVDTERAQVALRGMDPIGREVARQAGLEVVERKLWAADINPLLIDMRRSLSTRIAELGERTMWELGIAGRPELAELIGTLHYRFSYGQNALLHCREAGYLCGVLAAELGMDQQQALHAGMLHDIGKAVDHDVEGSHAIIGGELLRLFGTPEPLVHAVKAHHFEEEPSTDLALLTICADAISASRPGARRDTLTAYLARLDQLQQIATRHHGVERAFPMQAGREVRVTVSPRSIADRDVPPLCAAIARDIEAEMQYPGVIKVTVIRETMATATAKSTAPTAPQVVQAHGEGGSRKRRRRGGRGRDGGGEPGAGPVPVAAPTSAS